MPGIPSPVVIRTHGENQSVVGATVTYTCPVGQFIKSEKKRTVVTKYDFVLQNTFTFRF